MPGRHTTQDELQQLLTLFPPQPGTFIAWEALEELFAPLTRADRRFRTIYRAWIRHVRRFHNRRMVVLPGKGLHVLQEHERVTAVTVAVHRTFGAIERSKEEADAVQIVDLTTEQRDVYNHVRLVTHRLHRAMAEERSQLQALPLTPLPADAAAPQQAAVVQIRRSP